MSRAVAPQRVCQNDTCVDDGRIRVRFSNGAKRSYCPFHARHVVASVHGVEVIA